jgi:class I fructose-bisphosphate aldolase
MIYFHRPSTARDLALCGVATFAPAARGETSEAKGGRDSLYAIDYAARVACELCADIVKINVPKLKPEKDASAPKPYTSMQVTREEAVRMVAEPAGKALVLFSGGAMEGEGDLVEKVYIAMDSGATGLIFGRSMWQCPFDDALRVSHEMHELLRGYGA